MQRAFSAFTHTASSEQKVPRNANLIPFENFSFFFHLNSSKQKLPRNLPSAFHGTWIFLKNYHLYGHSLRLYAFVLYLICACTILNFKILTRNSYQTFAIPLPFSRSQLNSLTATAWRTGTFSSCQWIPSHLPQVSKQKCMSFPLHLHNEMSPSWSNTLFSAWLWPLSFPCSHSGSWKKNKTDVDTILVCWETILLSSKLVSFLL